MFKALKRSYDAGYTAGLGNGEFEDCPLKNNFILKIIWQEGWFAGFNVNMGYWLSKKSGA